MGWCHEFGPQIFPACDHPMVAGHDACSCPECQTVCKGRFAGCADVWARGPRSVDVGVRPSEAPERLARPASTAGPVVAADELAAFDPDVAASAAAQSPSPAPIDKRMAKIIDELAGKVRRLESEAAKGKGTGAPPAPAGMLAPDIARIEAVAKAVGGLAAGLDGLAAEVAGLRRLPDRLNELERSSPATAPSPADFTRLTARVEELSQAQVDPLVSLRGQLKALESAARSADAQAADQVKKLAGRVEALGSELEIVRSAPPPPPPRDPEPDGRSLAIEKVVRELVRSMEGLSAQVSRLHDVPKRLEALETVEERPVDQAPVEKALNSMGKRLDRMSTQVGGLKTLPDRVSAIEGERDRAESLTRGLGGAIDMIDQLSADVAAIQDASSAGNGSPP